MARTKGGVRAGRCPAVPAKRMRLETETCAVPFCECVLLFACAQCHQNICATCYLGTDQGEVEYTATNSLKVSSKCPLCMQQTPIIDASDPKLPQSIKEHDSLIKRFKVRVKQVHFEAGLRQFDEGTGHIGLVGPRLYVTTEVTRERTHVFYGGVSL